MNNLNKFTKDELIKKLENLENQVKKSNKNLESQIKSSENKNKISTEANGSWAIILDIFTKIKILILSLTIIAVLAKIFKKYKSIRAILKLINYIILSIFGVSIFQTFGLDFLTKLKYFFFGILAYIEDTTFYQFLTKLFVGKDTEESIRELYKKEQEINDWKAKFEEAERKREWENWLETHKHHEDKNEEYNIPPIILLLFFLGGSIGIWYYGKDILDFISPAMNIGEIIRNILRGRNNDDDPGNNAPLEIDADIELDDRDAMLVYAADQVDQTPRAGNNNLPPVPPAPPAPIPPTEDGPPKKLVEQFEKGKNKPTNLLDEIQKGKSLKSVETREKSALEAVMDEKKESESRKEGFNKVLKKLKSTSSNVKLESSNESLTDKLSNKLNEMRSKIKEDDSDNENDNDDWKKKK